MAASFNERGFQLRTIGAGHRLDGLADLLARAHGASVFDVGCNRGRVAYEFERYGATTIHGCDNYETGMLCANEWFADLRDVNAKFMVVDLRGGGPAIEKAFGQALLARYDFVLMLAIYHKLARVMAKHELIALVRWLADHCGRYFVWRGSEQEAQQIGGIIIPSFEQVHYSTLSEIWFDGKLTPQPCAIWARK